MLDLRTLYFTTALICLCLAGVAFGLTLLRRRDAWLFLCGAGNLLIGLGFAASALGADTPRTLTIIGANALIMVGFPTVVMSARALAGRACWPRLWPLTALVSIATAILLGDGMDDYGLRVGLLSLFFGLCDLAVVREAVRIARRETLTTAWALAGVFAVTAGVLLFRSIVAFAGALDHNVSSQTSLAIVGATVVCARTVLMLLVAAERRHQEWEMRALHDPLTGALNRAGLVEMSERRRRRVQPGGPGQACALMIDVDRFKSVNDAEGHDAGDDLLRLVAEVIRPQLRKTDLVARQGGDEFVVFLPDLAIDDAALVAEQIRECFQLAAGARHGAIEPTLSIGVSSTDASADLSALLSRADKALYASKLAGRNAVSTFAQAA